jgi:hypothetical protein
MQLSVEQLLAVGAVASVIVQILKWIMAWFKVKEFSKPVLIAICFVVSTIMAYIFLAPSIPPFDPNNMAVFINGLLSMASAVFGLAMALYGIMFEKILEKFKLTATDVVTKSLNSRNTGGGSS